jgi:hypothetical protein
MNHSHFKTIGGALTSALDATHHQNADRMIARTIVRGFIFVSGQHVIVMRPATTKICG